jgi:hypothetical protein
MRNLITKQKRVFAICCFIFLSIVAFAQKINHQEVISFLMTHSIRYNSGVKPIFCKNLDSLERSLKKRKLSYSRSTFTFQGNVISDSTLMGGGSKTFINNKKKPFVYYNFLNGIMGIEIEVIDGSDSI